MLDDVCNSYALITLMVIRDTDIDLKPPIFSDSLADVIAILPTYRALNRKAVNKMNEHHEGYLFFNHFIHAARNICTQSQSLRTA